MSTYRRKHYQDVANQISESYKKAKTSDFINKKYMGMQIATLIDMAFRFDRLFSLDNENYNRVLFLKACNIDEIKGYE